MNRLELAEQALDLANGKHVKGVSIMSGHRRVCPYWLRRVSAAILSAVPKLYTPQPAVRSYEVELQEGNQGEIILVVGGFPVLYLNPEDRKIHLVPNDTGEEIGLVYRGRAVGGVANCVHVVRDTER
jgi:hypothetical protein